MSNETIPSGESSAASDATNEAAIAAFGGHLPERTDQAPQTTGTKETEETPTFEKVMDRIEGQNR